METKSKPFFYVPRFLQKKNQKTFLEVCFLLEGFTVEDIDEILKAVNEVVPKAAIFQKS